VTGRATDRRATLTLFTTSLGLFMIFLDASIVNVALPDIQRDFDTGESGIQWVVAAYSMTMAMFMMWGATFGDLRGRRLSFVVGLVLFSAASLACTLAPGVAFLAVSRAIQGVGAAVTNVASLALLGAAYPDPKAKARAIGIWTGIAAVGFTMGPLIGGVLTEHVGWRSVFVFNPIVGAVALVLTYLFLAESKDPTPRGFDKAGQVLFIGGIGALTFGLIQGPHLGWLSAEIITAFVIAVAALAAFVYVELRRREPMMNLRLFRDRVYSTALYVVFAVLFCAYGTLLVITQYFQNVRDYSPEKAGLMIVAMGIPVVVIAPLTGRLVASVGGRRLALLGLGLGVVGTGILAASRASHVSVTLAGLIVVGTSLSLTVAPATNVAMATVEPERAGMASGILSVQRGLGSTAGFAIMGSVLAAVVSITLPDKLEPVIPNTAARTEVVDQVVDDANPSAIASFIGPGKPLPDNVQQDDAALDAADDAFVAGIRIAMFVAFGVVLSAFVLSWFMFPRPRRRESDEARPAAAGR
jgi:EmrB/QacA subfamily drug resistance transporter